MGHLYVRCSFMKKIIIQKIRLWFCQLLKSLHKYPINGCTEVKLDIRTILIKKKEDV